MSVSVAVDLIILATLFGFELGVIWMSFINRRQK